MVVELVIQDEQEIVLQLVQHKEIQVVLVFALQVIPQDLLLNMVLEVEVVLQEQDLMDTEMVLLLIVVKVD